MASAPRPAEAEIAAPYDNVGERILTSRRIPCICPGDACRGSGRTVDYSTHRGIVVERLACDHCHRTWTRVNA